MRTSSYHQREDLVMPQSRHIQDMTWRQVDRYMRRSDAAIVPVGSHEVHGASLPQGTDTFIVDAVALKLAERMDALIAPSIVYTYTGATRGLHGSISLPSDVVSHYLEAVLLELIRNGFHRVYVIQWHAPYYSQQQLTREIFEKTGVPVVHFGILNMPAVQSLSATLLAGKCTETAVVAAALKLLGKDHLLDTSVEEHDQVRQERPEDAALRRIAEAGGVVGHYFDHESQHVAFRKDPDAEAGLVVIEAVVDAIAGTAADLKRYVEKLHLVQIAEGVSARI
jgi:creatinine amidohydrolase